MDLRQAQNMNLEVKISQKAFLWTCTVHVIVLKYACDGELLYWNVGRVAQHILWLPNISSVTKPSK